MFIQYIEGPVVDVPALRRQFDRWHQDLASGASGWLGSTAGVTEDGTAFIAARFESAEAARANSDRAEQSAWWAETEKCFDGPVSFTDCEQTETYRAGGSDDAGFVQVIRGKVNDLEAARELMGDDMDADTRPDVIGGTLGIQPDGSYTMVVYFTSEEEARAGEAEDSGEFAEQLDALHEAPPRFLDLKEPWLSSPASAT